MESVVNIDAFVWEDVDSPDGYETSVRAAFGSRMASNGAVLEHLFPPMKSLHSIQIEVTTWCNLSCRECSRTKAIQNNEWENGHIPFERVRTIIEKLPRTRQITLQGVGEPSLHPQLHELVRLASESRKFDAIAFNTNGLTHDDQYWKDLGKYPELTIALSVDSLDPIVAEECRAGTNVERLWARLNLFHATFKSFVVALVASRINLHDVESTLRRIASVGAPVQITRIMSDDTSVVMTAEDETFLADRVQSVRQDHPGFVVANNALNTGFSGREKRCVSPFLSPYVRADGYLTPCCVAVSPAHYGLTRADDPRSWDAIRQDPGVVKWVSDYVAADPECCQGCSLNPARSSLQKRGDDIMIARRAQTSPSAIQSSRVPASLPSRKAASAFLSVFEHCLMLVRRFRARQDGARNDRLATSDPSEARQNRG